MNIVEMRLSELHSPKDNIRIHSEKQLKEFERSVNMFGQIRPLVVDGSNTVLCGNGLFETLCRLGKETASVYKLEGLSENQKKKLMIADNKIYSLGIDDLETLNKFLGDLGGDLDVPGFDEDILKSMVAEAEEVTEALSEYGTIDEEEIHTIQANKEKSEAYSSVPPTDQEKITAKENVSYTENKPSENDNGQYITCPECGCKIWL